MSATNLPLTKAPPLGRGLYVLRSTIGQKIAMAVSGVLLYGYVFVHLWGNLKIFQGPEKFNAYALWLRELGSPLLGHEQGLWVFRVVMSTALVVHVWAAYTLSRRALSARPRGYAVRRDNNAGYAAWTMRWGGVIIAIFIVYHVLQLTVGSILPGFVPGDAYRNVINAFSFWPISAFYILAMVAVGTHLWHGIWSSLQTLGLNGRTWDRLWRGLSWLLAGLFVLGNSSIPLAVLFGLVR